MKLNLAIASALFVFCRATTQGSKVTTQDPIAPPTKSFFTETFTFSIVKLIEAFNNRFPENQVAIPSSDKQLEFPNLAISSVMGQLNEEIFINTLFNKPPEYHADLLKTLAEPHDQKRDKSIIQDLRINFNEAVGYSGLGTICFKFDQVERIAEEIEKACQKIFDRQDIGPLDFTVNSEFVKSFGNGLYMKFPGAFLNSSSDNWECFKSRLDFIKIGASAFKEDASTHIPLKKAVYDLKYGEKSQQDLDKVKELILVCLKNGNQTGIEGDHEKNMPDYTSYQPDTNNWAQMLDLTGIRKSEKVNDGMKSNDEKTFKRPNEVTRPEETKNEAKEEISKASKQEVNQLNNTQTNSANNQSNQSGTSTGTTVLIVVIVGIVGIGGTVTAVILIKKRKENFN